MAEETKQEETKQEETQETGAGTQSEGEAFDKPIDKMTAKELREIAKEIPGVTGVTAMKKEELLELIKEEKGVGEEKPAKKKVKKDAAAVPVSELKKRIAQLRQEKEQARQVKDGKKVDILRLRINRLKKRTRKVAQG
jgi:cell division protein FtsX